MRCKPLRRFPPPSSLILMVTSSAPSAMTTRMGGGLSSDSAYFSETARSEFFTSSKSIWCRWPGTYANAKFSPPKTSTSGASPYCRMQMLRASSTASRTTSRGLIFVHIKPM